MLDCSPFKLYCIVIPQPGVDPGSTVTVPCGYPIDVAPGYAPIVAISVSPTGCPIIVVDVADDVLTDLGSVEKVAGADESPVLAHCPHCGHTRAAVIDESF